MASDEKLARKLAAILYADVAGYSRLTGEDEDGTHRRLRDYLDALSESIRSLNGTIIHYAGDAVLADFPTVTEALTCAARIQQAIKDKNQDLPEGRKVRFRIGVNLGEVIVDRDEIYGDGVNVAARLESLAEPGGICISEAVRSAAGKKLPLTYEDMGRQQVKNIAEPVHAYRVLLDADVSPAKPRQLNRRYVAAGAAFVVLVVGIAIVAWLRPWEPREDPASVERTVAPFPAQPSIAVLPFQNLSDDPKQEYFSDGITNDIITDLSKFSNLFVTASNSVFTYKGTPVKVKEVGRELGVQYVLEGSVQQVAGRVRINVQLIDATTSYHLWAERYDRDLKDIFSLQDEITRAIVTALEVTLTEDEEGRVARQYTEVIEAYDVYLRGRSYLRGTKQTHLKARKLFTKAIELDPNFAAAYADKSVTYFSNFIMPMSRDPKILEVALQTAKRSVALDDSLPLAHARLGWAYLATMRHEEAIAAGKRAIALDPNNADSLAQLGNILNWAGQPEEGVRYIKKAMRLNPLYPFNYLFYLGHSYYLLRRHEEAIALMKRVITRAPNFLPAYRHLAILYQELGREEEARAAVAEVLRIFPGASIEDSRQRCLYKRDPALIGRFLGGLRKAGMPEGVAGEEPMSM